MACFKYVTLHIQIFILNNLFTVFKFARFCLDNALRYHCNLLKMLVFKPSPTYKCCFLLSTHFIVYRHFYRLP